MSVAAKLDSPPHKFADATDDGRLRPEELRRVVSIHYYGRSGSLFLQSLLDNHPELLMIPGTYMTGFYRFWEMFGQLPAIKMMAAFITNYDVLFDARSPIPVFHVGANAGISLGFDAMGDGQDHTLGVDQGVFIECLLAHVVRVCSDPNTERISRRYFLQAVHVAYAEALGREIPSKDPVLVLQTHNPYFEEVEALYEDFGEGIKFLHCLREPVQTLGSWYAHWWEVCTGTNPKGAPQQLQLAGASMARGIDRAKPIFAQYAHHFPNESRSRDIIAWAIENTRGVRLEDLHDHPRETLERVIAWLGIEWNDSLLHSTFDGFPWQFRTTGGVTVKGFQTTTISKKHHRFIPVLDRLRLQLLFADAYETWGYSIHPLLTWRPLAIISLVFWIMPFRMETEMWRRQDWRLSKTVFEVLSSNVVVHLKVFRRWLVDLRRKPSIIQLLD